MDLERKSQDMGSNPALIVVDVINGFTDPMSPLGSECADVVQANAELVQHFRGRQLPIVFTTTMYESAVEASVFRRRLPALNILTPDSVWVNLDPALRVQQSDTILKKKWASAFFDTDLNARLKAQNVDSLVVTGLTTSGCVRATALDGLQSNYPVFIPREAVGDRNADAHEANLFDLHAKYADVVSLQHILEAVR